MIYDEKNVLEVYHIRFKGFQLTLSRAVDSESQDPCDSMNAIRLFSFLKRKNINFARYTRDSTPTIVGENIDQIIVLRMSLHLCFA